MWNARGQRRVETRSDLIADAASILECTAPGHDSLLAVVAEPLSSTTDFLEGLSAHTDWNSEVRALVASAVTNRQHSYAPSLADPLRTQRRPNGVALTTSDEPIGSGRNRTAEVTLKESGRIVLILERVTLERDFPAVAPQRRTSGSGGPGCCSPGPPVSVGIHCGGPWDGLVGGRCHPGVAVMSRIPLP